MKKRPVSAKSKKTTRLVELPWPERARKLPLALFHTTAGTIIGRVEPLGGAESFRLRLWAPAAVSMRFTPGAAVIAQVSAGAQPYAVIFQTIAFVETYLDLATQAPFGSSPVPDALVPAYEEYFEKVAAGEYVFNRRVTQVEQTKPYDAQVAPAEPLPWSPGTDPHAWLTRKVFNLDEDETIERDDPRRVRVKRAFFGWAYNATIEKVLEKFDFLEEAEVRRVYATLDDTLSTKEKAQVKAFLCPSENEAEAAEFFDQAGPEAPANGQESGVS